MAKKKNSETTSWDAKKVRRETEKAAAETPRQPRKKKKFNWARYLACVVLVSCLLAGFGWLLANDLCALNKEPITTTVVVEESDSLGQVATKLKKAGLIDFKLFFMFFGGITGDKDYIDPGEYELNTEMDYRSLYNGMHDYEADALKAAGIVKITIREGLTLNEIFDLLVENGVSTKEELEDAAANYEFQDYDFLDSDKLGDVSRMEGFLFPDTYQFDTNKSAVFALDIMLTGFKNQISEEMQAAMKDSGRSLHDIITMASIIEKEGIGDEEERKNIASVLYNRLDPSNPETYGFLQLDTTVYYALALEGKEKTDFTTTLESPYNTYKYPGLPAGPICNPGLSSIMAAIYPNDTDYYYFAAGKDGVNHFNRTLAEHNEFVNSDMYQPD